MNKIDNAVSCFKEGFSCSQAILSTYGALLGLERETALKMAAGFGGGMGRMALTCGAVTGAFLVIGLKYGATSAKDADARGKTYQVVREFTEQFQSRNGSIACKDLLGCDISTTEGFERAKQKDLINAICPKMVEDAAEILEEILRR